MQSGIVEEVALDAPGFAIHLGVFCAGIDDGEHAVVVNGLAFAAAAGLEVGSIGDEPTVAMVVEDFFAVEGDLDDGEVAENFFGFAFLGGEAPKGADGRAAAGGSAARCRCGEVG